MTFALRLSDEYSITLHGIKLLIRIRVFCKMAIAIILLPNSFIQQFGSLITVVQLCRGFHVRVIIVKHRLGNGDFPNFSHFSKMKHKCTPFCALIFKSWENRASICNECHFENRTSICEFFVKVCNSKLSQHFKT